jgi:hypothetical protein
VVCPIPKTFFTEIEYNTISRFDFAFHVKAKKYAKQQLGELQIKSVLSQTAENMNESTRDNNNQNESATSMIDAVSRAVHDCIEEELHLLTQDVKQDTILGQIKSFVSCGDKPVEDTEGMNDHNGRNQNDGVLLDDHNQEDIDQVSALKSMGTSLLDGETVAGTVGDEDDEQTNFLCARTNALVKVPSTLVFKANLNMNPADEFEQGECPMQENKLAPKNWEDDMRPSRKSWPRRKFMSKKRSRTVQSCVTSSGDVEEIEVIASPIHGGTNRWSFGVTAFRKTRY